MGNHDSKIAEQSARANTGKDDAVWITYEQSLYPSGKELSYNTLFGDDDPLDLCCPITQELFRDPVLLVNSGHTYERDAIEQWLTGEKRRTDPVTGQQLSDFVLVPNLTAKKAVDLWRRCKQRLIKLNSLCYNLQMQKSQLAQKSRILEQSNLNLKEQLSKVMDDSGDEQGNSFFEQQSQMESQLKAAQLLQRQLSL
eukprot:TRINITY_DN5636_c0_g1_i11.p2 TRINITY_DN5636_c0_g1~~TRINITY_DN5636_c0_g1_i11.p2  ORF type:complete len:221 (-),score=29.27 TRINITY_DN5636_c0_g1_i11:2058-2648(-)